MTAERDRVSTRDPQWIELMTKDLLRDGSGTKMLVAIDGFSEPGRECVPDELLMPQPSCGTPSCTCEDGFHGVQSHGNASVARVRRLKGVPRDVAIAAIASAMEQHEEFDDPDRCAESFLDEIAEIEEGRLVRREVHILLPFPRAARITAPHSIRYHVEDEP